MSDMPTRVWRDDAPPTAEWEKRFVRRREDHEVFIGDFFSEGDMRYAIIDRVTRRMSSVVRNFEICTEAIPSPEELVRLIYNDERPNE